MNIPGVTCEISRGLGLLAKITSTTITALSMLMLSTQHGYADYTTTQIFTTTVDLAPGYSRQRIDFGDPAFAFTTVVRNGMTVRTMDTPGDSREPVAVIEDPELAEGLSIALYRIAFPAFVDARVAGTGLLGKRGYNRIIQDREHGNAAFGHLAGATVDEESGKYERMARLVAVSRGREALFIYADFDHADYPRHQETLSRFLGAIEMEQAGSPIDALRLVEPEDAPPFLAPADWTLHALPTRREGTTDYRFSLGEQTYPNLFLSLGGPSLEEARRTGAGIIEIYNKDVETSAQVSFAGDAEMNTYHAENGEPIAHSYARGLAGSDGSVVVREFLVQKNHAPGSTSIVGLNSFDVRRGVNGFERHVQDFIFMGWVTGVSAYRSISVSLESGIEHFEKALDIRDLGH